MTVQEKNYLRVSTARQGKFISYLRVSTARQGVSGLGLEAQRDAVGAYLKGGSWELVEEVTEVESGKRNDRPELAKALALCRIHGAVLLVAKLDRLARNVAFISKLMESGVEFTAVDFPKANRLTVHILAAVAEHEASMISTRTKAALAQSKKALGGRRWAVETVSAKGALESAKVRIEKASKRAADLLPVIQGIQASGVVTLRAIAAQLNERGIRTSRGGEWSAVQVQRMLLKAQQSVAAP